MLNGIMRLLRPVAANETTAASGPIGPITTRAYIPKLTLVKPETMLECFERLGPSGAGKTLYLMFANLSLMSHCMMMPISLLFDIFFPILRSYEQRRYRLYSARVAVARQNRCRGRGRLRMAHH